MDKELYTFTEEDAEADRRVIAGWIAKLLQSHVGIGRKINKLDKLLPDAFNEYFGDELSQAQDVILTMCGIPEEKTPFSKLEIDTSDMHEVQIEYGFCRDSIDAAIMELESEDDLQYSDFLKIVYDLMGLK